MRLSHKFLIILCLSGTALSLPASAQDVPPAVAALLDNIERQTSIKPTYESIDTDGSGTVTISKLALNKPSNDKEPSVTMRVDEAVFANISDKGNGLFEIGSADFTNINGDVSGPDVAVTFSVPTMNAEGWYIKAADDNASPQEKLRASMNIARKIASGAMTVAMMGQSVTVDSYEQTWDGDPATGAGSFSMKVSNIAVPETALSALDQSGMLKQLGYSGLNIDLASKGRLDVTNDNYGGDMTFSVTSRNMGTINVGFSAAGVPIAVITELQQAGESGKEPDMTALMPQVQSISIGDASLRFEDDSITKKVLPMIAAMQGMDEASFVNMAGPMLQMGLMQLQSPALAEQATKAVNSFLKDPKSITIAAKPATPVTVGEMMSLSNAKPADIISRLGVGVSAND